MPSSLPLRTRDHPSSSVRPGASTTALVVLLLASQSAHGQVVPPPRESFRDVVEAQVWGGMGDGEGGPYPSFRLSLQRRINLRYSAHVAGAFLQDGLSHSAALTLGLDRTFALGSVRLEPFLEGGAGLTDARVKAGTYQVIEQDGSRRDVTVYRAVEAVTPVLGGGLAMSWVGPTGFAARVGVGYWHLLGPEGLSQGGLRVGAGVGLSRPDEPWYALASDRTPPGLAISGRHLAVDDTVEIAGEGLSLVAGDANGIERIILDGRDVDVEELPAGEPATWGLEGPGVRAVVTPTPPYSGQLMNVVVEDRAGLVTRRSVRVFPTPDRTPPRSWTLDPEDPEWREGWSLGVALDDASGIADVRIGACRMDLLPASTLQSGMDERLTSARIAGGWVPGPGPFEMRIRDRSGNETSGRIVPRLPATPSPGEMELSAARAERRVRTDDPRGSVHVVGRVTDPAGGWISRVTVQGREARLRPGESPATVEFDGWLRSGEDVASLEVRVETADGRAAAFQLPVVPTSVPEGELHVLLLQPEGEAGSANDVLDRLGEAAPDGYRREESGPGMSAARAADMLRAMEGRTEAHDVAWIHLGGRWTAPVTSTGLQWIVGGSRLEGDRVARLLREVGGSATLVSSLLSTDWSWRIPPEEVPGAPAPAGCYASARHAPGRVVDLAGIEWTRIVTALEGAADLDDDGRVRVEELVQFLGRAPEADALWPFDPMVPVSRPGVVR